jgi:ubiquinone/menaquinone biosynthesis C-methylase UbiE
MQRKQWNAEEISEMCRGYQRACVLMAAAELEIYDHLGSDWSTVEELAGKFAADSRGLAMLLDALAALQLLDKQGERYRVPIGLRKFMCAGTSESLLAMLQHQANCLRSWSQLAAVVKNGGPAVRQPSIRGSSADYAAFIEAMDNIARSTAPELVRQLQPLSFTHLLDVGGGSGSYTLAFLRTHSGAKATLFDLPQVMAQARQRLQEAGLVDRVNFVPGDFYTDELPTGADLAWVSAIVHQNSREQNRRLFARIFAALQSGGQILIRDFLMNPSRTAPVGGALFAMNMLVNTPQGGTYSADELQRDLNSAGFTDVRTLRQDETMHSVLSARKS